MSGSREESPDWLRSFQAPTRSALVLSSGSESLPDDAPVSEDENLTTSENPLNVNEELANKTPKAQSTSKKPISSRKRKKDDQIKEGSGGVGKVVKQKTSAKASKPNEPNLSIWTLSSDSESCPDGKEDKDEDADLIGIGGQSLVVDVSKEISLKKDDKTKNQTAKKRKNNSYMDGAKNNMEIAGEEMREKESGPYVSSSRLPLVLSEKVQRSKALVECEGESIDLSGDVGAVGRVVISDDASGNNEMLLDLKGTIYKTTIVPSRTFCVVSFGQSEAKIEAIMNDFIQLKPQSNVYEAETMVEGTLEGFSFDLEDDAEKLPKPINKTDETEGAEEKSNGKTGGKLEKTSGLARKKGKTTGGKPQKKAKKKSQVPKKTRARK